LGGLTPARLGTLRWYPVNTAYAATSLGTGSLPLGVCFDGNYVWAAESGGNQVDKLQLNGSLVAAYTLAGSPQFCATDGDCIWVTRKTSNSVTKFTAATGAVAATIATGTSPSYVCFDGVYVWVSNTGSNNLTKIPSP
jgi:DNA-binding beta-propeller fold protein YncE